MAESEDRIGGGAEQPRRLSPDQRAAHDLLTELRTRISTQRLPYQYGVEARALESLWEIFGLTRKAIKDNPGCQEFAHLATTILNVVLRPVTAKWHRAMEAGVLASRDGANDFRADLAEVREKLVAFAEHLQMLAYGSVIPDDLGPEVLSPAQLRTAFLPLEFGLDEGPAGEPGPESQINVDEAGEIDARRRAFGRETNGLNAIGLALSGGGIRSATFCLGVVQVLAARGLLKDFDYLSTVSGGGYTGSFISSVVGTGGSFDELAAPFGPDTDAVRHVRQNAKYLSAVDLKRRWLMVTGTLSGLIMNLFAPLFALSGLALLSTYFGETFATEFWSQAALGLCVSTLVSVYLYGFALRFGAVAWFGSALVAFVAGGALICALIYLIEWAVIQFGILLNAKITGGAAFFAVAGPVLVRFLPIFRNEKYQKRLFVLALYAAGLVVPILAVVAFFFLRELGRLPLAPASASWSNALRYLPGDAVLGLIFLLSMLFSLLGLNINLTGPHKLYRDALARTFVRPKTGASALALDALNTGGRAPYHLINAAVNLPSSTSPVLRDRRADFFLFSKHWIGSKAVGYHRTATWSSNGSPVDLATAMAISGAAASPHMGLGSIASLTALMTLLNIRLGFWLARPEGWTFGPPGFGCLVREMFGIFMSEHRTWLNVSDGGHIENMGTYELLRRRCKFIVCVDGEADPDSTFHGQLTLVRHAQIDLGVRIEPRLDDMRPDPKSRLSRTHAQLFRVIYPVTADGRPEGMGLLLYLKLSLTGNEAELLRRYRLLHPDFPHQSTLDQYFDEEQFEAYRQLGVHVAEGTFAPALMTSNPRPANVGEWFGQLVCNMLEPFAA